MSCWMRGKLKRAGENDALLGMVRTATGRKIEKQLRLRCLRFLGHWTAKGISYSYLHNTAPTMK